MNASRRQRKELSRTLKQFAFEQSPMFQQNQIQSMKLAQEFEFFNQPPLPSELEGVTMRDRTTIELGFRATRIIQSDELPIYAYELSNVGTHAIEPTSLKQRLSDDAWAALGHLYDGLDIFTDIDDALELGHLDEEAQDAIIKLFNEEGVECEIYQSQLLTFASCEHTIDSSYERGVSIAGASYDVLNSDAMHDPYVDEEYISTPEGRLWVPERYHGADGPLNIVEEIEVDEEFEEIVQIITDDERLSNDLLPYEDKRREVLAIVECLRKKRLTTN